MGMLFIHLMALDCLIGRNQTGCLAHALRLMVGKDLIQAKCDCMTLLSTITRKACAKQLVWLCPVRKIWAMMKGVFLTLDFETYTLPPMI